MSLNTTSPATLEIATRRDTLESEHLTLPEAAKWLRCSSRTLQRLLEDGRGPPVIRLSERRLIFRITDLRNWLSQRTRGTGQLAPAPARRRSGPRP
jgi:predicted DNA-binding transcriptional regulator AlpA